MAFTFPDKGEGDNDVRKVAVYALCDPFTGDRKYIGKSANPAARLRAHMADARLKNWTHKTHWINSLHEKPELTVLEWCDSEVAASECERRWIQRHRDAGANLTNATDGGEGQPGLRHTAETKSRMSIANSGRVVTEETRAKIRAGHIGKQHALGKKHSEEARERHRLAAMGKGPFRGMTHTPETIAKMQAAQLARWAVRKAGG